VIGWVLSTRKRKPALKFAIFRRVAVHYNDGVGSRTGRSLRSFSKRRPFWKKLPD